MRSSTPPCPGKSVPLSFTPARRFNSDSWRSPTIDNATSATPNTIHSATDAGSSGAPNPRARRHEQQDERIDDDGSDAAIRALPRLAGADLRRELVPAETAPGEIGGSIGDPHDRHRTERQPGRARLQRGDRHERAEQHDPADNRERNRRRGLPPHEHGRRSDDDPEERRDTACDDGDHAPAVLGRQLHRQRGADDQRDADEDHARRRRRSRSASTIRLRQPPRSAARRHPIRPAAAGTARPAPR